MPWRITNWWVDFPECISQAHVLHAEQSLLRRIVILGQVRTGNMWWTLQGGLVTRSTWHDTLAFVVVVVIFFFNFIKKTRRPWTGDNIMFKILIQFAIKHASLISRESLRGDKTPYKGKAWRGIFLFFRNRCLNLENLLRWNSSSQVSLTFSVPFCLLGLDFLSN